MTRADAIDLITQTRSAHGVHEAVTETARTVMCDVRSVTRAEYYTAENAGHRPEYVFYLTVSDDYQGERLAEYKGVRYRVIRTYRTAEDGIEITVERSDVNADD